jgi:7-cyano-7-deazaguanine synthase
VLLSGGIDSATALYLMKARLRVRALTFAYHGIARRELDSAKAVGTQAEVTEHRLVRVPDLKEAGDIPGYELRGLPPSYIPLRNNIFYSFAASYADETGAVLIVGGHNRDDQEVFKDVSSDFFGALQAALWKGSPVLRRNRVRIVRPLSRLRKVEVVRLAASLGVPLELTWSCHRDGKMHCWRCQGCLTRKRSFQAAGVVDPLDETSAAKIT